MGTKSIIKHCMRILFTGIARKRVCSMGKGVCVNFPCTFTKNTTIGDNCHFNGMAISGAGKVTIGNNFHSGKECRIITSYHNYDKGIKIPYDDTYITRDVTIEDSLPRENRV